MTNQEAIKTIKDFKYLEYSNGVKFSQKAVERLNVAMDMAISALEENERLKVELERSVKLKCSIGDSVFEIFRGRIQEYKVICIHLSKHSVLYEWELVTEYGVYSNLKGFEQSAIGNKVFLTREEAEQALAERQYVSGTAEAQSP